MSDDKQKEPKQIIPAIDGDIEVPIPSRDDFLRTVEKVAPGLRRPPAETDEPPEQSESD
jgi:hypothetical protein